MRYSHMTNEYDVRVINDVFSKKWTAEVWRNESDGSTLVGIHGPFATKAVALAAGKKLLNEYLQISVDKAK